MDEDQLSEISSGFMEQHGTRDLAGDDELDEHFESGKKRPKGKKLDMRNRIGKNKGFHKVQQLNAQTGRYN
jgi:hypothetical protein